jgi:hypothetical protein
MKIETLMRFATYKRTDLFKFCKEAGIKVTPKMTSYEITQEIERNGA